ncbi:MFS transporter [Salinicoccus roseus]|uniref:MFS transporter n=1 Tax=Salinicoccus roseus TaxID=45670 RepID=UPI003DA04BF8
MGLSPDGLRRNIGGNEEDGGDDIHVLEDSWTLKEATRTLSFWTLLICVGIPSMINTGITFHIVSIFKENGLEMGASAMVLSLMAMVGIPMSFVSGLITDRIRTNYILVMIFVIEIILLLFLNNVTTYALAILFGVIWGMSNGLERIGTNVVWSNYFGRRYVGSINGVGSTMVVIGSSLGPLPFGLGYDMFGSYTFILTLMVIFPVIGIISALLSKKPQRRL